MKATPLKTAATPVKRDSPNRLLLLLIYLGLAIYLLPMFPHGGSANELTRWATAASLVEEHSFEISWTEPLVGRIVDTATIDGKVYSNKAPGPAVLAAPFYALTRIFIGAPNASNIRISWFVMRLFTSTLPLFLLAFWLYRRGAGAFSLATLLFATPLFLYSLLFFSHVLTAVLIYLAFRLLYDQEEATPKSCLCAGLVSGFAVTCEFPAVVAVVVFGIGLLFTGQRDRFKGLLPFVAGGLPFALLLMLYNYSLFGSPFTMSYTHESFAEWADVANQGVFGIGYPTPSNAFLLLLSPARGLLFYSPVLLLSIVSLFRSPDRQTLRCRVKLAAILLSVLVLCGHGAAHGGWASGARYLVFVIPLLLDSFFEGAATQNIPRGISSLWKGILFGVSVILSTLPALTFPFAPPEFTFPHNNFWWEFLAGEHWFVPNLANLFGLPSSVWTILPAIVLLLGALFIVWRASLQPRRFLIGSLAAALLAGGYLLVPNLGGKEDAFRRATIAERFFRPGRRLDSFRKEATDKGDWPLLARVNSFEWIIADTRAFAPDDFPYLETRAPVASPTAQMNSALVLQGQGKTREAEGILNKATETFPFGHCEFSTNLAIIHYNVGRKEQALTDLEAIQPLVNRASPAGCLRSQFLLGSLYREFGRQEDAERVFRQFLDNSQNSTDREIQRSRQSLNSK